jgi:hypothetical protein
VFVPGLTPEAGGLLLNFTDTFHPARTGHYQIIVTVDSRSEITETNEANNILTLDNVPVAIIGDVNGDHEVNVLDAVVLALAWGSSQSDPRWNIKADLNHDGTINVLDGTRVSLHWNQTS